jgi:hypothetical protein
MMRVLWQEGQFTTDAHGRSIDCDLLGTFRASKLNVSHGRERALRMMSALT